MPRRWSPLENLSAEESRCGPDDFLRPEIRAPHPPTQSGDDDAKGDRCCVCFEAVFHCLDHSETFYPRVWSTADLQFPLLRETRRLYSGDGQYSGGEDFRRHCAGGPASELEPTPDENAPRNQACFGAICAFVHHGAVCILAWWCRRRCDQPVLQSSYRGPANQHDCGFATRTPPIALGASLRGCGDDNRIHHRAPSRSGWGNINASVGVRWRLLESQ